MISWEKIDSLIGSSESYFWFYCEDFKDVNLIIRPLLATKYDNYAQAPLSRKTIIDMNEHIAKSSKAVKGKNTSALFDTVIIIYLDAVSHLKFQRFYKKTVNILQNMNNDDLSRHKSVSLDHLHSIGTNSEPNYLAMTAGIGPDEVKTFFNRNKNDRHNPWIFDIAEMMGYETSSAVTGCNHRCRKNCHDSFMDGNFESGGFIQQYMVENKKRFPTKSYFPVASYCEDQYRPSLNDKRESTCSTNLRDEHDYWIANKFGMSYVLDWFRTWLLQVYQKDNIKKRFSMIVFEETHQREHFTVFDSELESILYDLVFNSSYYHTENASILLLSDHGLHFSSEFYVQPGKIANKHPFGYLVLPKKYLNEHQGEGETINHNSKQLISPLDLRATVLYWLTGRDWSASANAPSTVYANNYGQSLMTSILSKNRTCYSAGIPLHFCGCNLRTCNAGIKYIINANIQKIAEFINNRLLENSPHVSSICKPLNPNELIVVPIGDGCYENSNVIVADVYIKRTLFLVSITFRKLGDDIHVINANTISRYGQYWELCKEQIAKANISNNITDDRQQFCYCSKDEGWKPYLLELSKYFSD